MSNELNGFFKYLSPTAKAVELKGKTVKI